MKKALEVPRIELIPSLFLTPRLHTWMWRSFDEKFCCCLFFPWLVLNHQQEPSFSEPELERNVELEPKMSWKKDRIDLFISWWILLRYIPCCFFSSLFLMRQREWCGVKSCKNTKKRGRSGFLFSSDKFSRTGASSVDKLPEKFFRDHFYSSPVTRLLIISIRNPRALKITWVSGSRQWTNSSPSR